MHYCLKSPERYQVFLKISDILFDCACQLRHGVALLKHC